MKRTMILLPLLVIIPLLTAMGTNGGEGSPDKIPVPEKKFTATFIDQDDVITECRDVSIEGGTFLDGNKGEGIYTVSFDNIASIVFQLKDDRLTGIVRLKEGDGVELMVNKDARAYGYTKYGTFQIRLADLKKMTVGGAARKRTPSP